MWELAFLRPVDDPDPGSDAYAITRKDPAGAQADYSAHASLKEAIAALNAQKFEPIGGSVDVNTNRWAMVWRRSSSGTGAVESPVQSAAVTTPAQPKRRGRPPKLEAAPSAVAAAAQAESAAQAEPEAEAPASEQSEAPAAAAAPKRRGRPPKAKAAEAPAAAKTEAAAPKRRGRPPKAKADRVEPAKPAAKRGPGRPKKQRG